MAIKHPVLAPHVLEGICQTIAETQGGLTGTEIGKIILDSQLKDVSPSMTKWKRLYNSFVDYQNSNQCSNGVLLFISNTLQPVRYIGALDLFENRRAEVNKRLSFIGIELGESGKYRKIEKTQTISEAEQRAGRFKHKLESRNTHQYIFKYCSPELFVDNYFHSVFEATKSIADRIRDMTGLTSDSTVLINTVFSTVAPLIKINAFITTTDRSEHIGLSDIIKGLFSLIRNPTAHKPKIKFTIDEEEALDMMSMISYVHKRLDRVQ